MTEEQARQQGRPVQVARFPWGASGRAVTMGVAEGLTKIILDPETEFTDSKYRLSGFLRGNVSVVASIARFAAYTNNEQLLEETERLFRSAHGLISRSGSTPCEEPCCTLMEMTTAALVLTEAGRGQWWDQHQGMELALTRFAQYVDRSSFLLAPCKQPEDHTKYGNYEEKFKHPICLWVLFLTSLQIASQSCHTDTKVAVRAGLYLV